MKEQLKNQASGASETARFFLAMVVTRRAECFALIWVKIGLDKTLKRV
jgi:hypothetical protein